ncbi:MAG TPA: hypothetical protein VFX45_02755 [Solirubrobacterales bacterium]|nr:hypothetical protein [Solirubrobacterales bacterium]
MNRIGVPQGITRNRTGVGAIVLLTAAALLLGLFAESAPAAQIVGSDGKVYACYKAKGKRKGSVRLVAKNGRCKKGERKASWSATGTPGAPGQGGAAGAPSSAGTGGEGGAGGGASTPAVVALESKVLDLNVKLDALENILEGVNKEVLGKALDTVKGITNAQLLGAIGSVPFVSDICTQANKAAGTINSITGLLGIVTNIIPLGTLPTAVPTVTCPGT